ncbi:TPA: type II methionyl aminopeptidase [Candidatus Woesearchaeota archaeon]|nr:type II methionyl aminopeptidase [Candidatus Woesearchaeota archaeon]HIH31721.1 type II methionyl aminopeptidase [Candidatus Woesearchaeota archaeon]HIH55025.1 type II methionyl aminopeptidase [Candidatus Woesearchaeota archaeon]HIJ01033.1 type II methionyl aminopeptidase [Candidatus Woesearchaeota archaeon]HIJ14749.1 type II methionyl aminopeptidase [Candidatus Woesearchaeota archaeon]
MILDESEIDDAKQAGRIAAKAITLGKSLIKPNARMVEVLDSVESFIKDQGAGMAFPAQIAINNIAAHYCSLKDDPTTFKETDIIKLDLGTHINGIVADTAITVIFDDNEKYDELKKIKQASEEALENAIKILRLGITLGEIGLIIQESIAKHDLSPIKNLSGHGLGKYSVHEHPTIPNFNTNDKTELEENQLIAIEPFATNGHGMIYESSNPTIFSVHKFKPVRSQFAREILRDIQAFNGLPFTTRWLNHSEAKIRLAFNELRNVGILQEFPPLLEVNNGLVSQSEHTVIIREKPVITTLRK